VSSFPSNRIAALRILGVSSLSGWMRSAGLSPALGCMVVAGKRRLSARTAAGLAQAGNVAVEDVMRLMVLVARPLRKGGEK